MIRYNMLLTNLYRDKHIKIYSRRRNWTQSPVVSPVVGASVDERQSFNTKFKGGKPRLCIL